jgi:V/A-type H+-transporting ATPase subunit K
MFLLLIAILAGLLPVIPAVFYAYKRRKNPSQMTKGLILGLGSFNIVLALMVLGIGLVWLFAPNLVQAAPSFQEGEAAAPDPYSAIAAAAAVGFGSLGAAYAVSSTGSAAIGALAERPEIFGRALIFVGLAEGVAIYGLIIAFMILNS